MSVEAVARSPLAAGLKLRQQAGLSCADSLYRGEDPPPERASKAATRPSSEETRKWVGLEGSHAMASTSALTAQAR